MDEKSVIETYEEKKKRVSVFHLTSDLFAGKVFEDTGACQELCRILLKNDNVVIKSVKTQYSIRNLENHSVELDILAEDTDGNLISIELQMYKEASPFKRVRYYTSSIDMSILEKGKDYNTLPTVTVLYITKKDFIGDKRGYYEIQRKPDGQDVTMSLDNGLHEKYYNLEYPTEDAKINELFRYFKNSAPFYQTENFPRIVERVKYFKIQKKGVNIMCEIADRIRKEGEESGRAEGRIQGKKEDIFELLEEIGKVPQQIAECIRQEMNPDILSRWHKCAARVSSISEFETNM